MKVESVTLIQPLTGEVLSHYRSAQGYSLTTDDIHMGGGIWIVNPAGKTSFVASANVAGHGAVLHELGGPVTISGRVNIPGLADVTLCAEEPRKVGWPKGKPRGPRGPIKASLEKLESEPV